MTPLGWLDRKTSTQTKHQIYKTTDSIWYVRGVMQIVKDFFFFLYIYIYTLSLPKTGAI